jgi:hypothetical protein
MHRVPVIPFTSYQLPGSRLVEGNEEGPGDGGHVPSGRQTREAQGAGAKGRNCNSASSNEEMERSHQFAAGQAWMDAPNRMQIFFPVMMVILLLRQHQKVGLKPGGV